MKQREFPCESPGTGAAMGDAMNRFRKFVVAGSLGAAGSLVAAGASAQSAGWVSSLATNADGSVIDPQPATWTPRTQFNSMGGTNTIRRTGVGLYEVTMPNLVDDGGAVHVSALAGRVDRTHRCKVDTWFAGKVIVRCFDGGAPADGNFTALYFKEVGGSAAASAYAETPAGPRSSRSWNYAGGTNSIRWVRTGVYDVTFGDMFTQAPADFAFVTASGTTNTYCNAQVSS